MAHLTTLYSTELCIRDSYKAIHCYLDNDNAGKNATKSIMNAYGSKVIDESYRYRDYNDLYDCLMAMHR